MGSRTLRDKITINGTITESGAATFTQVTEDLSDLVDLYDNRVLIVDEIQVELPTINEVPATTAKEHTSMQITHTSQTGMIAWNNEDLIEPFKQEFNGQGTAGNTVLTSQNVRLPTKQYMKDEDKPILYHKTLYLSAVGTNAAAQVYYYKIKCHQQTISEKLAKALLADLAEEL